MFKPAYVSCFHANESIKDPSRVSIIAKPPAKNTSGNSKPLASYENIKVSVNVNDKVYNTGYFFYDASKNASGRIRINRGPADPNNADDPRNNPTYGADFRCRMSISCDTTGVLGSFIMALGTIIDNHMTASAEQQSKSKPQVVNVIREYTPEDSNLVVHQAELRLKPHHTWPHTGEPKTVILDGAKPLPRNADGTYGPNNSEWGYEPATVRVNGTYVPVDVNNMHLILNNCEIEFLAFGIPSVATTKIYKSAPIEVSAIAVVPSSRAVGGIIDDFEGLTVSEDGAGPSDATSANHDQDVQKILESL